MSDSLIDAVHHGDLAAVQRLTSQETLDVRDEDGRSALMWAARLGRPALVRWLLSAGAAVDARDARDYTALFHACHDPDADRGHPEAVALLLQAGADKEACIGFGVRPLMYAAGNGEAAVVQVLLQAGADPLARNEVGRTALMMVKDRDYVDVINLLHEAEAGLEAGGCGSRNAPDQQVITFLKPPARGQ